jgi:hypothetical protein
MLVRRVVVYDKMGVEIGRDHGGDVFQEAQELLMTMTLSGIVTLTSWELARG